MRKVTLTLLVTMLAGCFKVGPDYHKPQVETPETWRFGMQAAKDTTNLFWWEQFGDPVLNQLVERGIQNNLDLKIAIANVERFMGQYGTTRADLFPQIFGNGHYFREQPSSRGTDLNFNERDNVGLSASMQWEIDIWGKLRRAKEAAQADLMASEAVKRGVILSLASAIAQTYILLRTFDKDLEITLNVVQTLKEDLHIRRVRFQEGYTSELEVTQAESEYERRSAFIPFYEQNIAQTEHALNVLLGENPGPVERGKSFDELQVPAVPAGMPSELLARRPDIQQAEQELIAANARIGVAKGLYFPQITLAGDVGQAAIQVGSLFAPGANFWTVGSALLTPIFTAGKIAGQVQASEGAQQAALANYKRSIISAFREYEDALVAGAKTKQRSEKQAQRVAAVESYYTLSRDRYDEGYSDYLTVLDAVRNLFDAQIDLIQARSDNFTAAIALYRAMGGGWIAEAEKAGQLPEARDAALFP